ncbi:unnamed protein product [Rhizoctonia solani]|uniref:Uncharacterized protein n=1 Tax=Rhizoctonia solani TaxID=456999 RepID=A0A8H3H5Q9_9AGAM|nr:unnamed protein product [Rhizoctonia solani]
MIEERSGGTYIHKRRGFEFAPFLTITLLRIIMPSKLWHWEYFQTRPCSSPTEKDLYRNHQLYRNAWCRACISAHIEATHRKDMEDFDPGVASDLQCPEELLQAFSAVPPVSGRRESFESHIRRCKLISPVAKARLAQERAQFITHSSFWPSHSTQDGGAESRALVHPVRAPNRPTLSKEKQTSFESDLCKLWVANEWAWHAIDKPETQRFFRKWFPMVALPDYQKLSGSILRREPDAASSSMRNAISGKLATIMSRGWKSTKCNSLVASMLSVDHASYTIKVHNVLADHKKIDDYLSLVLGDIDYAERVHKTRVIAWVSEGRNNSRTMRVRLHRLRPHILVFNSWTDHINLVVSDILSQSGHLVDIADTAIGMIKWILHRPRLLQRLHHEQAQNGGKPQSLTLPAHDRWTSHYISFRSLLSASQLLRSLAASDPETFRVDAGRSPKQKEEAELFLKSIQDPNFWDQLEELDLYLEPLAIAANVSHASATRLDHILTELGRLYHVFSKLESNPKIREIALASLERCWSKSDQDPYILAVFLNPFVRGRLFSQVNPLLNRWTIYGAVKRVFKRVFGKDGNLDFYEAFHDYYEFRNEFSSDRWDYRDQQALGEREGRPLNLLQVWSSLLTSQAPNSGRSQLAHLAIHILSIAANSSGHRRMGHTNTEDPGRQKALDAEVVCTTLKRKHAVEGRTQPRLKRRFSHSTSANHVERDQTDDFGEAIADIDEDSNIPTMRALATQLHQDVLDDEDPTESDHEETLAQASAAPLPKEARLSFGTQMPVPLQDLFDYTSSIGPEGHGLDIFKSNGLANLQAELESYDLATREMLKDLKAGNATN